MAQGRPVLALAQSVMFSCAVLGTATTATGGEIVISGNNGARCPQERTSTQQPLVLFLHIHKAGGSSVVAAALAGLCSPKVSLNGNHWSARSNGEGVAAAKQQTAGPQSTKTKPGPFLYRPETMRPTELRQYLGEVSKQGVEFIAMEWGWFRTPTADLQLPSTVRQLISIRKPWDRMLSNMFFDTRTRGNFPLAKTRKSKSKNNPFASESCFPQGAITDDLAGSLKRFQACDFTWRTKGANRLAARLPDGTPQNFNVSYNKDNFLTRILSGYGSHPLMPLDQNDLKRAKAQLKAFDVIVVLELPETYAAMKCLGIQYELEHTNRAQDGSAHHKAYKTKAMYSNTTLARVAADFASRNQLDTELYDFGVSLALARKCGCPDGSKVDLCT